MLVLGAAASLAGCAHQDVVDTPVGWWHQLQGGEIAKQRPPPPGIDDPYPSVGTTPEHPPPVASVALRQSVTLALQRQRNLTTRINANQPLPPASAPPAPAPSTKTGAAPAVGSSATLDAAQAQPAPTPGPAPGPIPGPAIGTPAATASATPADDPAPELALPAVQVQQALDAAPVTLPAIPGAPPPPPRLPGIAVAAGVPADKVLPDYQVAPVAGTQIEFSPGSDSLLGGQHGALHAIAMRRGSGEIVVRGYGDAAAPDTDSQAQALTLASLRARAVAEALGSDGVPASAILLQAEAFGRGASVSLLQ